MNLHMIVFVKFDWNVSLQIHLKTKKNEAENANSSFLFLLYVDLLNSWSLLLLFSGATLGHII